MEFNHLLKKDLIKSICSVLNNYIILVFEEHGERSSFESSFKKKKFSYQKGMPVGIKVHQMNVRGSSGIRGDHQGISGCPQCYYRFLRVFQGKSG